MKYRKKGTLQLLKGTCHCGNAGWTIDSLPKSVTACNCTICRRYGALWAYGFIDLDIQTSGQTNTYRRRDSGDINFYFCATCGCVTHYTSAAQDTIERKWAAVNVRMSDESLIRDVPIRHFDGCGSFEELSPDGRTVKDMWF